MPAITATAPGKIILFGEHAVVYGRPAIAAPVAQVRARAIVTADLGAPPGRVRLLAPDVGLDAHLDELPAGHPIAMAVRSVLAELGLERSPACTLRVSSTIPLAAGLGSGAAISVAILRAFSAFLGRPLATGRVSALTYEVEKIYHGTPSGIDNTVVSYEQPVYFVRGQPIEILQPAAEFTVVIGDTGVSSPTAVAVGDVHRAWKAEPGRYDTIFDAIGEIARSARQVIERGEPATLGPLMDQNQVYLGQIGVSSPELERLVNAARAAGALGAKLSGGGRGGNMIALATPQSAARIAAALQAAGAVRTVVTRI